LVQIQPPQPISIVNKIDGINDYIDDFFDRVGGLVDVHDSLTHSRISIVPVNF
jgi:hypothetical protein